MKNIKAYYLVDKKTGKATLGPLATRQEARQAKILTEKIVQLGPIKEVR